MKAKVSILIPAYNVEPYIRQCLNSVCNQTLREIEIIIVNDGSKDKTLSIIKEYAKKDERIILIDKKNGGYGMAMNIATQHANGQYIGIVEPDDYVPYDMFEILFKKANEFKLDFVKADFYRFAKDEKTGDIFYKLFKISKHAEDYNTIFNPSEKLESIRWTMNTWSGIYKKSFLDKYKIIYNETPGAAFQDNGFWFQTFVYGKKAMILDTPLYRNRRDNPNSSVKDKSKIYAMNIEYDYIRSKIEKETELWNSVKGYYWLKKWDNYRATINRIDDSVKEEYIEAISKEFIEGKKNNEIDLSLFTEYQQRLIKFLTTNPKSFSDALKNESHQKSISIELELREKNKELERIKKSESYRIGLFITYIPRKLKKLLKKMLYK